MAKKNEKNIKDKTSFTKKFKAEYSSLATCNDFIYILPI